MAKKKTIVGWSWRNWGNYFCKTWTKSSLVGNNGSCRIVHLPDIFTSPRQMGIHGKDGVKIRITIEEV